MTHQKFYQLLSSPFGLDIELGDQKILFSVIGPQGPDEIWQRHLSRILQALSEPKAQIQAGWTLVLTQDRAEFNDEAFEHWLLEHGTDSIHFDILLLPKLPMGQAQSTWGHWLERCQKYLSLTDDPHRDYFVIRALEAGKPVLSCGQAKHPFILPLMPELESMLWQGLLEWQPVADKNTLLRSFLAEQVPPYAQMLENFVEPQQPDFDAYFYDVKGRPYKDLSQVPGFLQNEIAEVRYGSGTNKFIWLLYQFASEARLAIECGVFSGGTSVPLAKGLQEHHGYLISLDIDLSQPLLRERISKHHLYNTEYLLGSDLDFKRPDLYGLADIIYIDTFHQYEESLKELFLYDQYLKPGGIFLMHDLIATWGVGLMDSTEDYGYSNSQALKEFLGGVHDVRQISDHPMYLLAPHHELSPVLLAINTFLRYRPNYRLYKILDMAGMGILLKLPEQAAAA